MMIYLRLIVKISVIAALIFILGCNGGTNPVGVDSSLSNTSQMVGSSRTLWGLWQCYMDPDSGRFETVLLRTAAFTSNVNNLLSLTPGNFQVSDLDASNFQTEGRLDCTVTVKHPFPGLDKFNGFDVWGVFLHNGESALGYDGLTYGGGPDAGENEAVLLNADGYTRWFNQPEFDGDGIPLFEYWPGTPSNLPEPTAMLNGYRIFADGLDTEQDYYEWITSFGNADNRGWFTAGAVNSRRYEFQFPIIDSSPVLNFQYAVIATWEQGDPALTGEPTIYDPGDFPTSANCEEAFFLGVTTIASDLYYAGITTYGGDFIADIEVFDWQGGSVGGLGVPNEIERIIIEGDFIPGGSHEFSQVELAAVAAAGTDNSSVFQVEILNCEPKASGEADLSVIVEAAGLNGGSYNQGFPTEYPDPARRAVFMPGTVTVSDEAPIPPAVYNLILDIERNGNDLITGIILDWDDNVGITEYNIYRQDPFDSGDDWVLIPDSPVAASEYTDTNIVGNEAYQYKVIGLVGIVEVDDISVEAYALLENAEDNATTDSIWEHASIDMYGMLFNEFGTLDLTPNNGTYCWDEGGTYQNGPGGGGYNSAVSTVLASPVLPLPEGADTCEMEFCARLNNLPSWSTGEQVGAAVGVTNEVVDGDTNPFTPSQNYIEGFDYNWTHIDGLSKYGYYPNITTSNDMGYAKQIPSDSDVQYMYGKFALPDVFIMTNARAAFVFGAANTVGGASQPNAGTSFDDIAVLVY